MSGSVNKVILVGNLGKDPEVRRMQSGDAVVNFSLAVSESWRDKTTGERKDKTEWVDIVVFNENLAKVAENYLRKGSKVYIEGQLQTRTWDKDGVQQRRTEVVLQKYRGEITLLDSRKDGDTQDRVPDQQKQATSDSGYSAASGGRVAPRDNVGSAPMRPAGGNSRDLEDSIPF